MTKDKAFTTALRSLAIPIIAQSLLSRAIGTADTLMLNVIGQTELSAVSLGDQLSKILNNTFLGFIVGTSVLLSQYLSSDHKERANNVFSISCIVSTLISLCFSLVGTVGAEWFMRLLTNSEDLVAIGTKYLRIVGWSFLCMAFSQPYLVMLKARHLAVKSMIISTTALVLNLILNAVFIFGLFGAPKLGVRGVAIATLISRIVELAMCLADFLLSRYVRFASFAVKKIWQDYLRVSLPQTTEGLMWILAASAMTSIIGHVNDDMVAANSIVLSLFGIARVASIGLADAGAILIGGDLGRRDFDTAKAHASQLTRIAILAGAFGCVLMLIMAWPVSHFMDLTARTKHYLLIMFIIQAGNVIFAAITYEMLCGVFTAGGDTRFGMIIDMIIMWLMVLNGYLAFKLGAAPLLIFFLMKLDEPLKTPIVLARYRKGIWVHNMTEK